jgi:hypothetical protein
MKTESRAITASKHRPALGRSDLDHDLVAVQSDKMCGQSVDGVAA